MKRVEKKSTFIVKLFTCFFSGCIIILCSCNTDKKNKDDTLADLTRYVDPFIGTGFHGHVFLGANVPFGAVQLGPVNITEGWDWCSGYNYSDSTIMGFSHTHLSGTGIGDLGDILFMPVTGEISHGEMVLARGVAGKPESGYYSTFSHDQEKAVPGYYSVLLKRYNIKAELTATERVGFHQYSFPQNSEAEIIIDLGSGIGWDATVDSKINYVNDSTITGYRFSTGWAKDQRIFFTAVFSKPIKHISFFYKDSLAEIKSLSSVNKKISVVAQFDTATQVK